MRLASNVVWFALWKLRFGQIGPRTAGRKAHVEIPLRTYAVIGGSSNPLRTKTIECPLASRHFARLAVGLEVFLGFGALFGGGALILAPDGHLLGMPVKLLAGSPFPSFLVPGIILFGLIGVAPLMAAAITLRRQELAPLAPVAVGLTLIGWVAVEMVVLAGLGSLAWTLYLVLGASIAAIGVGWWHSSPRNGNHSEL